MVAELHDGHTYVLPINVPNMERWFPVRFYAFPDGLYVTSVAPEYADLAGKRVLKIGALDADTAIAKAVAMQAANNPLAAREGVVWLSNAAIAEAIGAALNGTMSVTVANAGGTTLTKTLAPFEAEINDAWNQQGEMFGPRRRKDAQPYVTAFGGRGPLDFRKTDPALPPHLRYRLPYYMVEMPEKHALYFQWNFVQDWGDEPFMQFSQRLFKTLDAHPDWRLIVDVRYNSGGDGSKVPAFIKQIIKHDRFDAPGNLFVITGRKTFSAAVDFVAEAKAWTSAIFVGEPTGAGLNAYGDAEEHVTPGLHISFQSSTNFHGHGDTHDTGGSIDPDIPAVMTGADYFAGPRSGAGHDPQRRRCRTAAAAATGREGASRGRSRGARAAQGEMVTACMVGAVHRARHERGGLHGTPVGTREGFRHPVPAEHAGLPEILKHLGQSGGSRTRGRRHRGRETRLCGGAEDRSRSRRCQTGAGRDRQDRKVDQWRWPEGIV